MSDDKPDKPGEAAANESSLSMPDAATDQAGRPSDVVPNQLAPASDAGDGPLAELPAYARGLMRIRVPVRVKLASQRKPIQEIIELGPGSIVKFDKTCDEPLELCVGDRPIATGEVVKVGDKFGLRVGALLAP
jgi:flagellar motor switch protein FliN/FliY